jgi:hypothetical protein
MSKSRELKWHEEIFTGVISAVFGLMFLLNGFSYLATFFLLMKTDCKESQLNKRELLHLLHC